jgi:putative ABC transport system permease protein
VKFDNTPAPLKNNYFTASSFRNIGEETKTLTGIVGYCDWIPTLTGAGEPERLQGALVSPNFFRTLGMGAHLGRTFDPEEMRAADGHQVVLSSHFWQRHFGADPGVIGKALR